MSHRRIPVRYLSVLLLVGLLSAACTGRPAPTLVFNTAAPVASQTVAPAATETTAPEATETAESPTAQDTGRLRRTTAYPAGPHENRPRPPHPGQPTRKPPNLSSLSLARVPRPITWTTAAPPPA